MPTSRNVTPAHVFPFILAIPLFLLLAAIPSAAVDTGCVPFSPHPVPDGFHKAPMAAPWEDDAFTDGIPPGPAGDDHSRRKARPSRTIPRDERIGRGFPLCYGTVRPHLVLIETLLYSFLIGLPPPVVDRMA